MLTIHASFPRSLPLVSALALLAPACGANETRSSVRNPGTTVVAEPALAPAPASAREATASASPTPATEETDEADAPAPPTPEPVVVEAGTRLGPIHIGMSEAAVRELSLPEAEVDPRSRRFGPYLVFFEEGVVRRVEAYMGDLGRVQIGDQVLPAGSHIHEIRDAIGDCRWYEGGGERYRCSDGGLFVQTAHRLDPALYVLGVQRR